MKVLYPMRLSALPMERIWGGEKLGKKYNKNCGGGIGETWELSVRKNEKSIVLSGIFAGRTLADVISDEPSIVGRHFDGGDFPLLIKLIDAARPLSVQVHPDDEYASRVEGDVGKTEMWHILEAEKGARIVCGLADGISAEDFARAARSGRIERALRYVEVHAGDTYFIPSGLVHAIGEGIVLAEVQQNSDLTYRVFDFGRRDKNGNLRELHTEKAIDVVKCFSEDEIDSVRYEACGGERDGELLAHCRYFKVRKCEVAECERELNVTEDSFVSLICVRGEGKLLCRGEEFEIRTGDSYFLPAGLGNTVISGNMTVILSEI